MSRVVRGIFPELTSRRGRENKVYQLRAFGAIKAATGMEWLVDKGVNTYRQAILAELGRVEDDGELLELARRLCELKPTAREAVAMVRRYRLGRDGKGTAEGLYSALMTALNAYLQVHPATTPEELLKGAELLQASLRKHQDQTHSPA